MVFCLGMFLNELLGYWIHKREGQHPSKKVPIFYFTCFTFATVACLHQFKIVTLNMETLAITAIFIFFVWCFREMAT